MSRRQPFVRRLEADMLRLPHLLLADLGGDDRGAILRRRIKRADRALRHDRGRIGLGEIEASRRAPAVDPAPPLAEIGPGVPAFLPHADHVRSEEHTSELQSLMRLSYAVLCLKKKTTITYKHTM